MQIFTKCFIIIYQAGLQWLHIFCPDIISPGRDYKNPQMVYYCILFIIQQEQNKFVSWPHALLVEFKQTSLNTSWIFTYYSHVDSSRYLFDFCLSSTLLFVLCSVSKGHCSSLSSQLEQHRYFKGISVYRMWHQIVQAFSVLHWCFTKIRTLSFAFSGWSQIDSWSSVRKNWLVGGNWQLLKLGIKLTLSSLSRQLNQAALIFHLTTVPESVFHFM